VTTGAFIRVRSNCGLHGFWTVRIKGGLEDVTVVKLIMGILGFGQGRLRCW